MKEDPHCVSWNTPHPVPRFSRRGYIRARQPCHQFFTARTEVSLTMRAMIAALSILMLGQAGVPPPPPPTGCPEMATALQARVRNDTRLRDWPQLARYRDGNRQLAEPAAADSRVVFM